MRELLLAPLFLFLAYCQVKLILFLFRSLRRHRARSLARMDALLEEYSLKSWWPGSLSDDAEHQAPSSPPEAEPVDLLIDKEAEALAEAIEFAAAKAERLARAKAKQEAEQAELEAARDAERLAEAEKAAAERLDARDPIRKFNRELDAAIEWRQHGCYAAAVKMRQKDAERGWPFGMIATMHHDPCDEWLKGFRVPKDARRTKA